MLHSFSKLSMKKVFPHTFLDVLYVFFFASSTLIVFNDSAATYFFKYFQFKYLHKNLGTSQGYVLPFSLSLLVLSNLPRSLISGNSVNLYMLQEKGPSTFAFPTAFRCFQLSLTAFQKFDTKISYQN